MKHGFLTVGLFLSLCTTADFAATTKPKCDSNSTSIVRNDTLTTETKCDDYGFRRVTRKKNGKEDGRWEAYGPTGKLESLSTFKNGEPDGLFEIWYGDGTPYERKFYRSGRLIDTVRLWYANGKAQTLEVYDTAGRRNGWSMNWADNGILLDSIHYAEDEKKEAFYFWESGKLMFQEKTIGNPRTSRYDILEAATFDSTGRKTGEVTNGNGRLFALHTRGYGVFDTLDVKGTEVQSAGNQLGYFALSFFPARKRGSISRSIVKKDTFTTEIKFDEMGHGCVIIRKKNGKEDGLREDYNSIGKPMLTSTFKNGRREGIHEGWFDHGFPMLHEPYRNGRPIGTHKRWYGKDKLKSQHAYSVSGQLDGWSMDWAENGNLKDSVYYVKGEKKEGYFYWESGKSMLYEKTRWNPRTGSSDGYYQGPYEIPEAASFDSTGKKNGEVKGGNGRIILLSICGGIDTLEVKFSRVRKAGYFDGNLNASIFGMHGRYCTE